MEQPTHKKLDITYCHIKDHNLPYTAICIDQNCQSNRLACKTCIHDYHKNHTKNSFISIIDLMNEDSDKHLLKNWPIDKYIRSIGEIIYNNQEPQNELDFLDKKLENQIDEMFDNIYSIIKEILSEIKSYLRSKFLNRPINTELKLTNLRNLYDKSFDISNIRECLLNFSQGKLSLIQIETLINDFFHKDRADETEKIQFLFGSLKNDLANKESPNHAKHNLNQRINKKIYNLEINETLFNEYIEQIKSILKVEAFLDFATLKTGMKPLQVPENINIDNEYFELFASTYAKMDDINSIYEIKNSHSEDISNLMAIVCQNPKKNTFEKLVVSTSDDLSIKIWDINKNKLLNTIPKAHEDWILSIAYFELSEKEKIFLETEISNIIVTGSADGNIKLWALKDAKLIMEIKEAHKGWIYNIEILPVDNDNLIEAGFISTPPISNLIVSTSTDKFIKIWDWITCECLRSIATGIRSAPLTIIPYKRSHIRLASPKHSNTLGMLDQANESNTTFSNPIGNTGDATNQSINDFQVHNTQKNISMISFEPTPRYSRINSNISMFEKGSNTPSASGITSPHGIIFGGNSNSIYDKQTPQTFTAACIAQQILSKRFLIANAGLDSNHIKVWDWAKSQLIAELKGKCSHYSCLACLPVEDDHPLNKKNQYQVFYLLAAAGLGSHGHLVEIWDFWDKKCIKVINEMHSDWIKSLRVVPSRRKDSTMRKMYLQWLIVTGSSDKSIKFWDWYTGEKLKEFTKNYPINRNGAMRSGVISTQEGSRLVILSSGGEDANNIIIFGTDDIIL